MSLSEVMLKTLIPSNFLDSDDEEIKSLTCPPETDDLQRNEFHMFNDYFGLSNLVQRVRQANNDFDYFTGEEFGVSKLQPRRDRFDSIDSENSSSGSCDSFTDHFGDGPFQPFNSSSLLHSAASKRKEAVVPPSRRIKPSARAPAPAISNRGTVCVFCRNNGESEEVYLSHLLKGPDGKTTCPILRAYTCPICKASGDESHTIKYCPQNQQAQANGGQLPKVPRNNRILPKRSR